MPLLSGETFTFKAKGPCGFSFSQDFRLTSQQGWLFAQSGDNRSWFALKAVDVSGKSVVNSAISVSDWGTEIPGGGVMGSFYTVPSLSAFLIVESSSSTEGSYNAFVNAVIQGGRIGLSSGDPGVTYRPVDGGGPLTLFQTASIPEIDSKPVTLPTNAVFHSPYLQSSNDEQTFTVQAPTGNEFVINFSSDH
jgi:hypothetical protein